MSNEGKIILAPTVVVEEGGGPVSNAATNLARQAWERELSVDGKHIRPDIVECKQLFVREQLIVGETSFLVIGDESITGAMLVQTDAVITNSLQVADGIVTDGHITASGLTAASLTVTNLAEINVLFAGEIVISSVANGGAADTGMWLTDTLFQMKLGGEIKVDFDTVNEVFLLRGEVIAEKVTILSNSENDVTFGADVHIDGDLYLNGGDRYGASLFLDNPTAHLASLGFNDFTDDIFISNEYSGGDILLTAAHWVVLTGGGSSVSIRDNGAISLVGETDPFLIQQASNAFYLHVGSGAPGAGLGATGDLYISTGGSFWFRQAGGWVRLD